MHACLGKARSESLLYFRISSGVFKQKTNSSSVRRIVFAAEVLEGCTLAWERREVNPFCIFRTHLRILFCKILKNIYLYLLCPLSILKILSVRVNFTIEMSRNLCFDRLSRTIENTDFRYKRVLNTLF